MSRDLDIKIMDYLSELQEDDRRGFAWVMVRRCQSATTHAPFYVKDDCLQLFRELQRWAVRGGDLPTEIEPMLRRLNEERLERQNDPMSGSPYAQEVFGALTAFVAALQGIFDSAEHPYKLWPRLFLRGQQIFYQADVPVGDKSAEIFKAIKKEVEPVQIHKSWSPLEDWIMENRPRAVRAGKLSDALARAKKWRLRWWVKYERAIAERFETMPVSAPDWRRCHE